MEFIHSDYVNSLTKQIEDGTDTTDKDVVSTVDTSNTESSVSSTEMTGNQRAAFIEGLYNALTIIQNLVQYIPDIPDDEEKEVIKEEKVSETAVEEEEAIITEAREVVIEPKKVQYTPPVIYQPEPKKEEFKVTDKVWKIVYPADSSNVDSRFDLININKIIGLKYSGDECTIYTTGSTIVRACTYKEYQDFAKSVNYVIKGDTDYQKYSFENYYSGEADTIRCEYYFVFDEITYASDIRYDSSATIQLGPHLISIPNIEVPDNELSQYDLFRNRIIFYWKSRFAQQKK